jgi:hypothetical protein
MPRPAALSQTPNRKNDAVRGGDMPKRIVAIMLERRKRNFRTILMLQILQHNMLGRG